MRCFGCLLLALVVFGCGQKPVSYRDQIQPIMNNRCVKCHGGESTVGKISLISFESLMGSKTISGKQALVYPGSPTESRLYVLCATNQAHFRMPPDTSAITPLPGPELELLAKWITQGAKNN
jgi:Planctomycete cytochrome C